MVVIMTAVSFWAEKTGMVRQRNAVGVFFFFRVEGFTGRNGRMIGGENSRKTRK